MTRLEDLYRRLNEAHWACSRANRWGETRRFAGRAAGNRLDKIDHINSMILREEAKHKAT